MKRFSLLPNVITAFGLSCGLFVIFKTMLLEVGENAFTLLQAASILILIAAFADLADGAIARLIKAESDFGGEFDSLSDSVTFGVAPPLLVLKGLANGLGSGRLFNLLFIVAAMIYTLCGVLRLVRYNLHRKGNKKVDEPTTPRRYFIGLPIPAGAALVLSAGLMLLSPLGETLSHFSDIVKSFIMMGVFVVVGYCMVSRIRFPSVSSLYFRVPTFYLVIATGVFAVFVLYGLLCCFAWVFFIISWGYFAGSLIFALYRRLKPKPTLPEVTVTKEELSSFKK